MEENIKEVVLRLTKKGKTIATMESCTGGALANAITNISGASEVFKFGAVTYSNEYKIKLGVSKDIIAKYSVYSIETAKEMSKQISAFASANYGVGITGKLNRVDKNNLYGQDDKVYISIYDKKLNKYYTYDMCVTSTDRNKNKQEVLELVAAKLLTIIT